MLKSKDVLKMEQELKQALSIGFFEHGTHTSMDLPIYGTYSSVHDLRMLLEAYEEELRDVAEEIKEEFKRERGE